MVDSRELGPRVLAWAIQLTVLSDTRQGEDSWAVVSRQGHFLCQAQPEKPGVPTLAWRHRAPRGATLQPSHPPACPDLPQTLCLSCQHLLPASSLPPAPVCFSSRTIASHRGSHPREVVFWRHPSALHSPIMPHSPKGDSVGGWGPGRRAASSGARGFVSSGSWFCWWNSEHA